MTISALPLRLQFSPVHEKLMYLLPYCAVVGTVSVVLNSPAVREDKTYG